MNLTLYVWRQKDANDQGRFVRYEAKDINSHMSFLEMLDVVNEQLTLKGEDPIAFDHDCREGICGMCGVMINGRAHGPWRATTVCQLHMREYKDGDVIRIEPWRARAFPVLKDLIVDRKALDKIIQSGGYISVVTGSAPEANSIPVPKQDSELSMDAAACIGCGACVAACPNASVMLFTAAKTCHLDLLPQGRPEWSKRVLTMAGVMDDLGFGNCTNHRECEAVCPKQISINFIARFNREYLKASLFAPKETAEKKGA